MLAVIMAGGRGVRLNPYTIVIPKPLLPYKNKSIIDNIMSNLSSHGFDKYYIMLRYKNQLIKSYIEMNYPELDIEFIIEEKDGMGTCGGLSLLKDKIKDDKFLVMNGDIITNVDYRQLYDRHRKLITVVTTTYVVKIPFGVVTNEKTITEKPTKTFNIVAGIYVMDRDVLKIIPKKFYNMNELLSTLKKDNIEIYHHNGIYIDIGSRKILSDGI